MALDLSEAGRTDHAVAVVALEDGRIVVAGTAEGESGTRFLMVRMTTQGSLDPSFGERDGYAWTGSITSLSGFHRTASGQFVACGTRFAGPTPEGRIVRFDSAGDLVARDEPGVSRHRVLDRLRAARGRQRRGRRTTVVPAPGSDGWTSTASSIRRSATSGVEHSLTAAAVASGIDSGTPVVPTDIAILADGRLTVALDGYGWGHLALLSFAPDGRTDTGSAPSLTDRFYDMGWPELPPSAGSLEAIADARRASCSPWSRVRRARPSYG